MKDKIELSYEAFKRWFESPSISKEHAWQSLCAEAEKIEKIVKYGYLNDAKQFVACFSKPEAEIKAKQTCGTVIRLVEAGEKNENT